MSLPRIMRLKGYRAFNYIHKNSKKYYGKLLNIKVARSNPEILKSHKNKVGIHNFKLAISISKKVSKKSVIRNKLRRIIQNDFLKNFKNEYNHVPYWVLVSLKSGDFYNYEKEVLKEFQSLIVKTGLLK